MRRRNKYGAKKVTIDGITFDSKAEARYYQRLKLLQKSGEIKKFDRQVPFELVPKYISPGSGKTVRSVKYVVDFVITYSDGRQEIIDVKGTETSVFKLKAKLFMHKFNKPLILAKYNYRTKTFHHEKM